MAGRPRAWALPHAGAPRQGEEGAELRLPRMDPVLPALDLRYPLRVGETAQGGSAVRFLAAGGGRGACPQPSGWPDAAPPVRFWL